MTIADFESDYYRRIKNVSKALNVISKSEICQDLEDTSYEELVLYCALHGIQDVDIQDILLYDMSNIYNVPYDKFINARSALRLRLDKICSYSNMFYEYQTLLLALVMLGKDRNTFKKTSMILKRLDENDPIKFLKICGSNIDVIFSLSSKNKTNLFLNWFDHRTAIKAKYHDAIERFYGKFKTKLNEFNSHCSFLN